VGKANDPFEHEADRVANEVMSMPSDTDAARPDHAVGGEQLMQRKCACSGGCDKCKKKQLSLKRVSANASETAEVPSSVDHLLHSSGMPLDGATRAFMEPRFGYDFSHVRVHADSAAAQSTRDVSALAFTVGNHIAFAAGQYSPGSAASNRLLAHELAHVVQQGGATSRLEGSEHTGADIKGKVGSQVSRVLQRAGDPAALPIPFACPPDFTTGRPAGPALLFRVGETAIDASHDRQLTNFINAWVAAGGTDNIIIHGYASTIGARSPGGETLNWNLSCDRAQNTRNELIARGVPPVHITVLAHGTSTDFGSAANNQRAVISTSPASLFTPPLVFGTFTPLDDFAGRSHRRFGVDELVFLGFDALPAATAADFGGLEWHLVSGGGTLSAVTTAGTATYLAPAAASVVRFEIRVSSGVTAGRVVTTERIDIVEPNEVRMNVVAGSAPNFGGWHQPAITAGTWGVGFRAHIFVFPEDVSFLGINFTEGTVAGVVTPPGSFLSGRNGLIHHGAATPVTGGLGNAITGTPLAPAQDGIWSFGGVTPRVIAGISLCGDSTFLWAIPWRFQVGSGAVTPFAGGFTADQIITSDLFCNATAQKAGAGPVCRRINGTAC
jgi:outer membrane protein OmpA-like peptidoglycan-associated protein